MPWYQVSILGIRGSEYGVWADLQIGKITQRFRWIVPGTFTMGSPESEKNHFKKNDRKIVEVQHEVTISKGYWMADSECTQALWQEIIGSNPAGCQDLKNPVETVSWDDCQGFLAKLNTQVSGAGFRLPSEAEWEYACRAGTKTAFSFDATISTDQVNYDGRFLSYGTVKGLFRGESVHVKSLPPNAWGLYEMHGNVEEWCNDWFDKYPTGAVTDPTGPVSGSDRVTRGGNYISNDWGCQSGHRSGGMPNTKVANCGFRFVTQATP